MTSIVIFVSIGLGSIVGAIVGYNGNGIVGAIGGAVVGAFTGGIVSGLGVAWVIIIRYVGGLYFGRDRDD